MRKFWETEGRMIKIFTGMFFLSILFFIWISSLGSRSLIDYLISAFYTWLFFWFLFIICAIVFGDHYPS